MMIMKRIIFAMATMMAVSLALCSCSKDDGDSEVENKALVGTWIRSYYWDSESGEYKPAVNVEYGGPGYLYHWQNRNFVYTFKSDGTYRYYENQSSYESGYVDDDGSYSFDGKKLRLDYTTFDVQISGNECVISGSGTFMDKSKLKRIM